MIPDYRIRIYCFIAALLCLLCAWALSEHLYDALTLGQLDVMTGRNPHKIKEHFVFSEQPWRFSGYLLRDMAAFIASGVAGLWFVSGIVRGRRAFGRWRGKFR
ncbi:hypothetical protein JFT86_19845 [Pseudomonas sp. TH06]|uniref:hypothetical protein n=1 Tax=Pseudomonas sp. TH06 TaxID=2796372 RepID=UPI001914567B|nr:hypothetical protein [Pseudomonas sp. TH06]MBK5529199.1 hypothetical protein [Pseudomonas sp. TH06]